MCIRDRNVTFGLLHQWLTDMGMTISKNTLRNWLKQGKTYLDELVCVLKSIACLLYISSHAKNKFVKASNQGGEPTAERFSEILKERCV